MLIITATLLARLMACNGSRLMVGFVPIVERDDTAAKEGDAVHWYLKEVASGRFGAEELIDRKAPNGFYIDISMAENASAYLEETKDGQAEVETSYGGEGWQVNGRADKTIYNAETRTLRVPDFKYGWSIVEPDHNWTLISHAIGWCIRNPDKPVDTIVLEIYQPRPHHALGRIRRWKFNYQTLSGFYAQINATLSNPSDVLNTGKHCYKCPALATCPAARAAQMNGIEASEKAFVDNLDNDNLSFQLDHLARAMEMLKHLHDAYSELATHKLREGQIIHNYSLEKGKTMYKWPEHMTAEILKVITGLDLTKKDLVSPAQAIKLGVPKAVVETLRTREETATKLVRVDANAKAAKMFNDN